MIDFHTHILPEMDDGSSSLAQTMEMLRMEYSQGVHKVLATSHFYAGEDFPERFLKRRAGKLKQVREALLQESWGKEMQILGGAEVAYFTGISEAPGLSGLCIEGTSALLLEMPFSQWDKDVYQEVKKMVEKRKLTLILAHIERHYGYQKNREVWDRVFELPLYAQMNAETFLNWKKRRTGRKLLKKGYAVVLGSDCHDTDRRRPNLEAGREMLQKKEGKEILERLDRTGKQVFG